MEQGPTIMSRRSRSWPCRMRRTASLVSTTNAAAWAVIGSFDLIVRGEGSGMMSMICWFLRGLCMVLPVKLGIACLAVPYRAGCILRRVKYSVYQRKYPQEDPSEV